MTKYIRLIGILCLLFSFQISNAQDEQAGRSSSYLTYVYKITAQEAMAATDGWYFFLDRNLLHTKVDSFQSELGVSSITPLAIGHYLLVSTEKSYLQAKYYMVSNINVAVFGNSRDLTLFVHEKSSLAVISDAVVSLKRKKLKYHEGTQAYVLKKNKAGGIIVISANKDTAIFSVENEHYRNFGLYNRVAWSVRRVIQSFDPYSYDYENRNLLKGYLVFNKPKYLLNDTLKWKAFLVKKNGTPYNKDVKYFIYKRYGSRSETTGVVVSAEDKGAFFDSVLLGDSLTLDQTYKLDIVSVKNDKLLHSNTFHLEEYQLNEIKYAVRIENESYQGSEPINIYLSGNDANGFPVTDARASITLRPGYVYDKLNDTVFVPNVIWKYETDLDPLGETKLTIPDSVLPNVNLNVDVEVVFNNSNNETQIEETVFTYTKTSNWVAVEFVGDSIIAKYMEQNKSKNALGILYSLSNRDTVTSQEIQFPYTLEISNRIHSYRFVCKDVVKSYTIPKEKSGVQFYQYRSADSIMLKLENPRKLQVHLNVIKNLKPKISQTCTEFDTTIYVPGNEAYSMTYSYMWAGYVKSKAVRILKYENNLKVKISQPKRIYPGQKADIKVAVTDNKDRPIKNVNLTAYSINSQFAEFKKSSVPYLGKFKYKGKFYASNYVVRPSETGTRSISKSDVIKFGLDSIEYYKYTFPKDGFFKKSDTTLGIKNAQFSPFIFERGYPVAIHLIYVDNEIVYLDKANGKDIYSFIVEEGCHTIRLRTPRNEYKVENICIKNGEKVNFSIDAINLSDSVLVKEMPSQITQIERNALNRNYMQVSNKIKSTGAYFRQGKKTIKIGVIGYYDDLLVGPIEPGRVDLTLVNEFQLNFEFEPGYIYHFEKGLVKMNASDFFTKNLDWDRHAQWHSFYAVKRPIKVIKSKNRLTSISAKLFDYQHETQKGNGELKLDYSGDSSFFVIQLHKVDSPSVSRLFHGNKKSFKNLPTGKYQLLMITNNNHFFLKSDITIHADGVDYLRLKNMEMQYFDSLSSLSEYGWAPSKTESNILEFILNDSVGGLISGKVIDKETHEPLPFVNLELEQNGLVLFTTQTDFDGHYIIAKLPPGVYSLRVKSMGYKPIQFNGIRVENDKISPMLVELNSNSLELQDFTVIAYKNVLIDKGNTSVRHIFTEENFKNMAVRSATNVAKNSAGVYSAGDGSGDLIIRGARSSDNVYYIDGMKVVGSSNLPKSAIGTVGFVAAGVPAQYGDEPVGGNIYISKVIRNRFDDSGFWVPNLITDKNGEAHFKVTFPDNITKWETSVLAMDGKKRTGKGVAETISFKPLMAQLSTPRFLIKGDQSLVIGKITSYSDSVHNVKVVLTMNKDTLFKDLFKTDATRINSVPIQASSLQDLSLVYSLKKENGYFDGEERTIPVFESGLKETSGSFYVLKGDTSIQVPIEYPGFQYQINIQNNKLNQLLSEIKRLEDYPYYCMEQSSSKLIGYLFKKKIKTALNEPFKDDREIKKLIKRIESGQNEDGGWGWWPNSQTTHWMTTYVFEALKMAEKDGYEITGLYRTENYLTWELDKMETDDLLFALKVVSYNDLGFSIKNHLKRINKFELSQYQRFMMIRIYQNIESNVDISEVVNSVDQTVYGSYYWKGITYGWNDNSNLTTLLAYQIIQKSDSQSGLLPKIRDYFTEMSSSNYQSNTIETAKMLSVILPDYVKGYDNKLEENTFIINGSEHLDNLDVSYQSSFQTSDSSVTIEKKGSGTVYLSLSQNYWNNNPEISDSLYTVDSWFENENGKVDSLESGKLVDLKVRVIVKKKSDYVMIEVPIPGGCSYANNSDNINNRESHREYYKHKTSVFCESLPKGEHVFTISLQPRFNGKYTLNPVRVEMMYFPVLYGNNGMKESIIK